MKCQMTKMDMVIKLLVSNYRYNLLVLGLTSIDAMAIHPFRCILYWADAASAQIWYVSTSDAGLPQRLASLYPYTYRPGGSSTRLSYIKTPKILMTVFEVIY